MADTLSGHHFVASVDKYIVKTGIDSHKIVGMLHNHTTSYPAV